MSEVAVERASIPVAPSHIGSTPTAVLLATAADMLDEMSQRLGGLTDTPIVARKLRELRFALSAHCES